MPEFNASIASEPSEKLYEVTREGARILQQTYGIDQQARANDSSQTPDCVRLKRSDCYYDAIKTKLAAEKIAAKKVFAVPPVMRPGVSQPRASYSDEEAACALKAFKNDPSPKSAGEYLAPGATR